MKWNHSDYKKWIREGQPINTEVLELYISFSMITSLEPIKNLINLEILYCHYNEIGSLDPIKNLINLKILHCYNNNIQSLDPIKNLINLKILCCSHNKIQSLDPIKNLINVDQLDCGSNKIKLLEPIKNLINLEELGCSNNKIQSFEPLKNLTNLKGLYCSNNEIHSLEPINDLTNLRHLVYLSNPIEYIPPNIVRRLNTIKNNQNTYNDSESVHNHNVQESIRKSIQNVLNIKPIVTDVYNYILNDDILTSKTKDTLFVYINCKDVHSTLNITFEELLLHVINRIEINKHKSEIKSVLNIEMLNPECKCFTERFSRLVNCLNGFDDLVKISEIEQIGLNKQAEKIKQIISSLKDLMV